MGDSVYGVSIGWLICIGARLVIFLFDIVNGTRLYFFDTPLGLGWKDLLAKGVVMVHLHLMNSTTFFFKWWVGLVIGSPRSTFDYLCASIFSEDMTSS